MNLRDYISAIATGYDRAAGMGAPTQQLLRSAPTELASLAPVGFKIVGSGGAGAAATIPWFGFLNPDETTSPQEGLYVVYLFAADLKAVYLTLIQGIVRLHQRMHPPAAARQRLADDGKAIRQRLDQATLSGYSSAIDLGANGQLPAGYEAGAVAAIRYDTAALPSQTDLETDIHRMFALYEDAIRAKQELLLASPGTISTASGTSTPNSNTADPLDDFKPKDATDYLAYVQGGTFIRTRRHEVLIRDYGTWLTANGLHPSTAQHPIDLVVAADSREWIIEGEIIRHKNAAHAVREAIGQLFEYREFFYAATGKSKPRMVGLFSESIGGGYEDLLATLGIEAVWRDADTWRGSANATAAGLAG